MSNKTNFKVIVSGDSFEKQIPREYFGDMQSHDLVIYLFMDVHLHAYEHYDFERLITSTRLRFGHFLIKMLP